MSRCLTNRSTRSPSNLMSGKQVVQEKRTTCLLRWCLCVLHRFLMEMFSQHNAAKSQRATVSNKYIKTHVLKKCLFPTSSWATIGSTQLRVFIHSIDFWYPEFRNACAESDGIRMESPPACGTSCGGSMSHSVRGCNQSSTASPTVRFLFTSKSSLTPCHCYKRHVILKVAVNCYSSFPQLRMLSWVCVAQVFWRNLPTDKTVRESSADLTLTH